MITERDIQDLFEKIMGYYPKFSKELEHNAVGTGRAWHSLLEKAPNKGVLLTALKRYAESNKWHPAPCDILQISKAIVGREWGREAIDRSEEAPPLKYTLREDQCRVLVGPYENYEKLEWCIEIDLKNRCIFHNGVWRRKMDFAMDILGARLVNRMVKFWCNENGMTGPEGLAKKVAKKKFPKAEYAKLLDELVALARTSENPRVPNYRKFFDLCQGIKAPEPKQLEYQRQENLTWSEEMF